MFICHRNHLAPVLPSGDLDRSVTQGWNQQNVLGNDPSQRPLFPAEDGIYQPVTQHMNYKIKAEQQFMQISKYIFS